jgi:MoaA/NifB/PqqE/SkfB family radical SAM enzyme
MDPNLPIHASSADHAPRPKWAADYDAGRQLRNKPFRSVCYAPFTTLDFGPTGDVIVCCANAAAPVGNIRKQSLKEIWTGPVIEAFRSDLKRYRFPTGCDKCANQVASGNLRTTFSKKDDTYALDASWERGPARMDFRLSNACNLACIMCFGVCSSTIRREVEYLPPLDCTYPESFFEELADYIPSLQHAGFTGGEPFLVQNNYRVWDLLIEKGPHVQSRIVTNGTVLNDKVRRYLEQLKLIDLCVSIDGATRDTFERIRRRASFDQVLRNLEYFADYCRRKGTNLRFAVCGLAANYPLGRRFGATLWTNVVQPVPGTPPRQPISMLELSPEEKQEAVVYLTRRYEEIRDALDEESRANYQVQLNSIGGPELVSGVKTGAKSSAW